MSLKSILLNWLQVFLQPIVERKFVFQDTWQLEMIEQKSIKLPYVLLENKSIVLNKFRIPVQLESIELQLMNKNLVVGKVLYSGAVKLEPKSQRNITMDVQMNHITALFQLLRFTWNDTVSMDVKGDVHIKFLGMDFFIPIVDQFTIPKSKFKLSNKKEVNKDAEEVIYLEDLLDEKEHTESPDIEIPDINEEIVSKSVTEDINVNDDNLDTITNQLDSDSNTENSQPRTIEKNEEEK
ncbi:MAG: hypothetical protein M9958_05650 [Chitinophagales bacterium]|nr:hypothetical protein [Chitinophagales bacterium]